jgi:hypothetical protein
VRAAALEGVGMSTMVACCSCLLPPSISLCCVFFDHRGELPDIWSMSEEGAKIDQAFAAWVGGLMGRLRPIFR